MNRREPTQEKIDTASMKDALKRSGYMMEQRVIPVLEMAEYIVETNPVYPDPDTAKLREYDFSAERTLPIFEQDWSRVRVRIEGECINNEQPLVLFDHDTPMKSSFGRNVKYCGVPVHLTMPGEQLVVESLHAHFAFYEFHHYCVGEQSTQFCAFEKKKKPDEWMACHPDVLYSALTSLMSATHYQMDKEIDEWIPLGEITDLADLVFFYPVLVVHGDLFICKQDRNIVILEKRDHLQYRRQSPLAGDDVIFHVDVIRERYLPRYLDMILEEHLQLIKRMCAEEDEVRGAVKTIVNRAREIRRTGSNGGYADFLKP